MDDAANPGTSITNAKTLISDHVAVIVDISLFDYAWASTASAAKIPVVGAEQSNLFDTNPDFYSPIQTVGSTPYAEAAIAKKAGAKNIGILYCAESPTCASEADQLRTAGQQLGIPLVYRAAVSAAAPNYTAQCVAAQQAKAQALNVSTSVQPDTNISVDCNRQGYNPIYVANDASYAPTMDTAPIGKNFLIDFTTLPFFADTPAVQAMNTAVDKYYPGLRSGHGGLWSGQAARSWPAGLLIRDAVKGSGVSTSGTITAAAFTQGLYSLKNDTLDGWSPPLTFVPGQPHPVKCWFTGKIVNGSPSVANNAQPTCESNS